MEPRGLVGGPELGLDEGPVGGPFVGGAPEGDEDGGVSPVGPLVGGGGGARAVKAAASYEAKS